MQLATNQMETIAALKLVVVVQATLLTVQDIALMQVPEL